MLKQSSHHPSTLRVLSLYSSCIFSFIPYSALMDMLWRKVKLYIPLKTIELRTKCSSDRAHQTTVQQVMNVNPVRFFSQITFSAPIF